jgi:hypothetical protein
MAARMDSQEDEKKEVVVIEACMDRRLVELLKVLGNTMMSKQERLAAFDELFLTKSSDTYRELRKLAEELDPSRVVIISNAGANPSGHARTFDALSKKYDIARIIVLTHTNCGAMATVAKGLVNGAREDTDEIFRHLGGSAYAAAHKPGATAEETQKAVETIEKAQQIQAGRAREYCGDVLEVQVDVSVLRLREEGHEHWLVKADPEIGAYAAGFSGTPLFQTYGIVGAKPDGRLDEAIADTLGMAKKIDTRRARVR